MIKLPEVEMSSNVNLPTSAIVRLIYVGMYGPPHDYCYDIDKLTDIYIKYNLPWDEEACPSMCQPIHSG